MKRRILITLGLSLALLLCLSGTHTGATAQPSSTGKKLVGTWDVTLRFPVCSMACQCPGGVPNIPIPALHTYSRNGTMEEVSGGTLYRSDALGSWEHVHDREMSDDEDGPDEALHSRRYLARYKFFIFNSTTGARTLTEVVTSQIELQERDTFEATAMFDLFANDGSLISTGCPINITGTRF